MGDHRVGVTYRHYKGNTYRLLAFARHSETHEQLVVYQDVTDPEKVWVRPKGMFFETVSVDGRELSRFTPIDGDQAQAGG